MPPYKKYGVKNADAKEPKSSVYLEILAALISGEHKAYHNSSEEKDKTDRFSNGRKSTD